MRIFAGMKQQPSLLAICVGTGFGAGFWPWGPGTMGAIVATLIWWWMSEMFSPIMLIGLTVALIVVGTWAGTWAVRRLARFWGDDPSRVVIDEMVGVWITRLVCPLHSWTYALAGLVAFRFFDIVKPLGVRALDRRKGPFWVMADDLLAGFYGAILLLLVRCLL